MTHSHQRLNRDVGLELPGCQIAMMRQREDEPDSTPDPTSGTCISSQHDACLSSAVFTPSSPLALKQLIKMSAKVVSFKLVYRKPKSYF